MKRKNTYSAGFSFVEMIILIAVSTVIMLAVSSSTLLFYRSNENTVEQAFAVNSARKGVEFLVRDIREAAYADDGSYPLISIDSNEFNFYSDIDRDDSVERVRYFLDGINLRKGVTSATGDPPLYATSSETQSLVSDNIRNGEQSISIFTYIDRMGNEVTDFNNITDVVFIQVNLIVNINPLRLPKEFTLRSSATIRNLRDTSP